MKDDISSWGFSNAEWQMFSSFTVKDMKFSQDNGLCKTVLKRMALRYKTHAVTSQTAPKKNGYHYAGTINELDRLSFEYLSAVERQFPLDKRFEKEFRKYMTGLLSPEEEDLSGERSRVLWDCCTRLLLEMMNKEESRNFVPPVPPIFRIAGKYPFSGGVAISNHNQVTIE